TSVASAVEALSTAKTMDELPELEAVARTGELSSAQLAVVADAAKADPTALCRLLSKAKKTSLAELREEAARIKAQADPDPEARAPKRRPRPNSAKVIFRLDLDCWLRGYALPGDVCEVAGFGSVPVSVIEDVVANGNPFLAAVLTKAESVVGVAHLGRRPTA